MLAPALKLWSAYRRTAAGIERFAVVPADCEGQAVAAACRLPGAPKSPLVAHHHSGEIEPVDFSLIPAPARRSRRHAYERA